MLNYSYYPFKNKLEDINEEDLLMLKNVSEGWYIDYKREEIRIIEFAKHISAFANQYGGWLIIGISESLEGNRTASKFTGITNESIEKVSRNIREASSAHISPEVLYEEKIVNGPLEKIGLSKTNSILIVGIPMSHNTPHIHSSGRIYRRLADQSKPKEETERHILDTLWERGSKHRKKLKKFLTKTPKLPNNQSQKPWVHIFFKPSESQNRPAKLLEFEEFYNIVKNPNQDVSGTHAPMQAISTAPNGYIARQVQKDDPSLISISIRWWHDGTVRLDIPFNQYSLTDFFNLDNSNIYAKEYCDLAIETGYKNMKIVDYSIFSQTLAALSNSYLHMLKVIDDKRDINSCFTLKNVFHTFPYIDSKQFIERSRKLSLPLITDEKIIFPQEPSEKSMFLHKRLLNDIEKQSTKKHTYDHYRFASPIIYQIFKCSGLVSESDHLKDLESWGFNKMNNVTANN